MKQPIQLYPAFQDYLWGGTNLKSVYPACDKTPIAEAWVLSCHPDGPSTVVGETTTLADYVAQNPDCVGKKGAQFPFFPILIKLIDAQKSLSVQVHPDDAYALKHENSFGKTEMWYVLDCKEGAALYYGFEKDITKEEMARRIADNTLTDVLKAVPVKKGDVFFIPAGTIHAIGEGMLIAEIQQNSNTTYRVYDYGRVGADGKPRALHIEQALAVTDTCVAPTFENADPDVLADCEYFKVKRHVEAFGGTVTDDSFIALLVVDGTATLTYDGGKMELNQYDCIFMPADMGDYALAGDFEILEIGV
ncbi:MAG: class I mannose-6-phosphate isomerase [Clostridia bacterium]|nr:class I mannose-6-phosphate isomerase [Clostridia bacterium]